MIDNNADVIHTRWLYIMGMKETMLLISNDIDVINNTYAKHYYIKWYKRYTELMKYNSKRNRIRKNE